MSADKEVQHSERLTKKARTDEGSALLAPPTSAPFPRMETPAMDKPPKEDEEGDEDEDEDDDDESETDEPLTQEQIDEAVEIIFSQAFEHSPEIAGSVGSLTPEQQRYFADRLSQTKSEISSFVFDFASKNPNATLEDVMREVGSVISPGQSSGEES